VGESRHALEATLRVRFAMRALVDSHTPAKQFGSLLRDLAIAELRSLSLFFDRDSQTEARALRLGKALPQSLVDVHFEYGHPALVKGLANSKAIQRGQLLTLSLRSCGLEAVGMRALAAALARSGGQLQTLDPYSLARPQVRARKQDAADGVKRGAACTHRASPWVRPCVVCLYVCLPVCLSICRSVDLSICRLRLRL
jgi:hypothetical protein